MGDRRLNFHESRDNLTPRAGVPQGEQPHVFLFRGLLALEELLPGSRQELLDHGAVPFDTGELPWLAEPGWLPVGQDGFEVLSATRPLFEYVIRCRVQELPGVQIRAGSTVINLRRCDRRWEVGLADRSTVLADLVVDASGRSSRLPLPPGRGGPGHRGLAAAARGDEAGLLEFGHRAVRCPCRYLVAVLQLLDGRQWLTPSAVVLHNSCQELSAIFGWTAGATGGSCCSTTRPGASACSPTTAPLAVGVHRDARRRREHPDTGNVIGCYGCDTLDRTSMSRTRATVGIPPRPTARTARSGSSSSAGRAGEASAGR